MRTVSIFLALTFAATAASAETATPAPTQARVPQQAKRSTPAAKATAKTAPIAKAAPMAATDATAAAAAPAAPTEIAQAAAGPTELAPTATAAAAPTASATPAPDADEADEHAPAEHAAKIPLPAKPPSATSLSVDYQRIGRDILKLQDQRGFFDCGNLQQRFKAIKLETALATPASRMQLYVTLAELSLKIERMRGIKLDSACLANPLAAGCM